MIQELLHRKFASHADEACIFIRIVCFISLLLLQSDPEIFFPKWGVHGIILFAREGFRDLFFSTLLHEFSIKLVQTSLTPFQISTCSHIFDKSKNLELQSVLLPEHCTLWNAGTSYLLQPPVSPNASIAEQQASSD